MVTVEEGTLEGGFGTAVLEAANAAGLDTRNDHPARHPGPLRRARRAGRTAGEPGVGRRRPLQRRCGPHSGASRRPTDTRRRYRGSRLATTRRLCGGARESSSAPLRKASASRLDPRCVSTSSATRPSPASARWPTGSCRSCRSVGEVVVFDLDRVRRLERHDRRRGLRPRRRRGHPPGRPADGLQPGPGPRRQPRQARLPRRPERRGGVRLPAEDCWPAIIASPRT